MWIVEYVEAINKIKLNWAKFMNVPLYSLGSLTLLDSVVHSSHFHKFHELLMLD